MSRTLPTECEHGRMVSGGDFAPDERCPDCESQFMAEMREIERLRKVKIAAMELVALGNQPGLDDEEWEAAFTALEEALR